ncbi:cell division protein ZapA [Clostridium sp. USBA 49]|jgi:cell division protein ZapA|uniref:cell division protein ZapA n=1 Tax=Clostridium TaxID=1485 RepID=UPI0009996B40|nr:MULTISPECIES: cell division protein ZapA [Clostridium]SKA83634.1 cell division protein ZapA [Clostridium sp. USBA 49]
MNVVTVVINGVEYNLRGEENEEYLHKVARYVDKKLKETLEANPKLSLSAASILTALNAADDMYKCDEAYEELQEKVDKLLEKEKSLKEELNSIKKQLKYLEEYNAELQLKLKNMTSEQFSKEKEEEVKNLVSQLQIMEETAKEYLNERNILKNENKELRFQLQSYKYKTIDLQQRLIEKGIDLVKEKRMKNSLIKLEK